MVRRTLPLIGLVAFARLAGAQDEPVDLAMVTRIRDEAFNNSKVMETLAHLTDVLGPRLTGSPQLRQANEWTRWQLEAWGLQGARRERWGPFGRGWTFDRASVHMVAPAAVPLTSFVYHAAMREERFPRKPLPRESPPEPTAPEPAAPDLP